MMIGMRYTLIKFRPKFNILIKKYKYFNKILRKSLNSLFEDLSFSPITDEDYSS